MPSASWVDLVGYRFEAVHDGVLCELLADPREGPKLASALLGESVESVERATRQGRVGRAKADVRLIVRQSGGVRVVGIETKVDSKMTLDQLRRTAANGDRVVLLCLGVAAMQTCTVAPLNDRDADWPIIDVTRWSEILGELELPALLEPYREAVADEVDQHRLARAIARGEGKADGRGVRQPDLIAWAWLDETWKAICALTDPGRFTADRNRSGPVVCWKGSGVGLGGFYLDLMAPGERRQIVLKASGVAEEDRRVVHETAAELDVPGALPPAVRALRGKTFTVLVWDVTDRTASESASIALEAREVAARLAEQRRRS